MIPLASFRLYNLQQTFTNIKTPVKSLGLASRTRLGLETSQHHISINTESNQVIQKPKMLSFSFPTIALCLFLLMTSNSYCLESMLLR